MTLCKQSGYRLNRPTFKGSALMNADADLIAAGLLPDLEPSKKLTLGVLGDLAGHEVNVQSARREFRQLLLTRVANRTGKA